MPEDDRLKSLEGHLTPNMANLEFDEDNLKLNEKDVKFFVSILELNW